MLEQATSCKSTSHLFEKATCLWNFLKHGLSLCLEVWNLKSDVGTLPQSHPWDVIRFHIWTQAIVENGPIFSPEYSSMTEETIPYRICRALMPSVKARYDLRNLNMLVFRMSTLHKILDGSWCHMWSTQHLYTLNSVYWHLINQWYSYPVVSAWAVIVDAKGRPNHHGNDSKATRDHCFHP